MPKKTFLKTFLIFLTVIGPGIITATAGNDSGGIATYSVAGAHFGYSMLWTLIPVTLLLIYTLGITTRLGVVTKLGLAALIREKFRVKWTMMLLLLLLVANFGTTVSEFAGISSAFQIIGNEVDSARPIFLSLKMWLPPLAVILSAIVVWFFIVKGNYKGVERVFLTLVFFYIAYIVSAILAKPDWIAAFKGLVTPHLNTSPAYLFTVVGVIGTTVTPWMYFYHNATLAEKDIHEEDLKMSRLDSIFGSITAMVIAFFIAIASAATIFVNHLPVSAVSDIALALKPLAGPYAEYLFAFGLFNASIFAAAILPLSTAFTICEALGWESGINKGFKQAPQFYTIFTAMIALGAGIMLIPNAPLLFIMRASQVANGILLPFFLIYLLLLGEDRGLMGTHATRGILRGLGWAATVLLIGLDILLFAAPFVD